jgi:CheY-like chemotaxis protein
MAYDVALLDSQMPDLNGFALARAIRNRSAQDDVRIMMLTSADRTGDPARCRELGINCYLVKPVMESDLLNALVAVLEGPRDEVAPGLVTSGPRAHPARSLRVLVAEDNAVNQLYLRRTLQRLGHFVTTATNGQEAIEQFRAGDVDLIFMDIQMPELDGLSATTAIRHIEQKRGGHVNIFAMTAHALESDRERCLAAGMDGYLSKPAKLSDIADAVDGVLAKYQGQTVAPGKPWGRLVWDRAEALNRVGGNHELLRELIAVFFQEYPALCEQLTASIANGDAQAVHAAVHTLKGSLGCLGLYDLVNLAQEIEIALQAQGTTAVVGKVETFMEQVVAVQQLLQASPVGEA